MISQNSISRAYRPTAKTLYSTSLAAVVVAVAYALFFMPSGNTGVRASSIDENSYTSEFNDRGMMVRAVSFGDSARYTLWSKGKISDDGNSLINGDVGSPSGKLSLRADQVRGVIDNVSGNSRMASKSMRDVGLAFDAFSQLPCTNVDAVDLDGKSFGPGSYCLASARLAGQMTLDAHGDPGAVFMFRVLGQVAVKDGGSIQYANGAESSNAFFFSETSVEIGDNANFGASALSRGNISIGAGSTAGKIISNGHVNSRSASLGAGFGYIEICKFQLAGTTGLEGLYFDFNVPGALDSGFGAGIVRVPLGSCSGPLPLSAGPVRITETGASTTAGGIEDFQSYTLDGVTSPQDSITNVNGSARSFDTIVTAGTTPQTERLINVTNRYAITGNVEICKYRTNANDTDVSGTFEFTIDTTGTLRYSTPVDQCTGPIFLVMPTGGPSTAQVDITEVARNNFINTGASTIPAANLVSFTPNTTTSPDGTGRGGTARVTVAAVTSTTNETIVNFFNAPTPGTVKICKIAGPGIPLGTRFDFTVSGTQGPLPGTATTQTVRVAAGPVGQGGFCNLASGTFIVVSNVTVTETLPPVDAVPGVPPGEIRVTRIRSTTAVIAGPDLAARTISVRANQSNGTVVTYTNIVYRPTLLKVCNIAGPGIAVGSNYTYNVSLNDPNGFYAGLGYGPRQVVVSAGPNNSAFGNCVFVSGPFDPIGSPAIGTFNVGQDVNIVETVPQGQMIYQISYVGTALSFTPPGTFVLRLSDPATNKAIFFNRVTPPTPGANYTPRADFDGNGTSDLAIVTLATRGPFKATSGFPYQPPSRTITIAPGDRLAPGDYDGDRKIDVAVYNNGTWRVDFSSGGSATYNWGIPGDKPVAADYDGDGKADIAAYRPSNGTWYVINSRDNSIGVTQWGNSTDLVAPEDWDGDGKADIGVYRPSNGNWYILQSSGGGWYAPWGSAGDRPVPADYDGDGKDDMAQYRASDHNWYIYNSSAHDYTVVRWGADGDIPVPGDYDGDGKYDVAMYRPSSGQWFILQSSDGLYTDTIGGPNDIPVEIYYLPF